MIVDPIGTVYTFDQLRFIADLVMRTYRACRKKGRGPRILFAAATVTITTTVWVFTDYLLTHDTRMSQCAHRHCTPVQSAANQQFLWGFNWSVIWMMACFTTAIICILALLFKLHVDLAWNIPTRKLMMRMAPGHTLDKLENQIKQCLNWCMWVLLALGLVFVAVLYVYFRNIT